MSQECILPPNRVASALAMWGLPSGVRAVRTDGPRAAGRVGLRCASGGILGGKGIVTYGDRRGSGYCRTDCIPTRLPRGINPGGLNPSTPSISLDQVGM